MNDRGWMDRSLGDVITLEYGAALPAKNRIGHAVRVFGSNGEVGRHSVALVQGPGIVVGRKDTAGALAWSSDDFWPIDTTYYVRPHGEVSMRWLYWALSTLGLRNLDSSTGVPGLNRRDAYELRLWIPPVSEQRRIAEILDTLDDQILKTAQIVDKLRLAKAGYLRETFPAKEGSVIQDGWTWSALREVAEIGSGSTPSRSQTEYWKHGTIPWVKTGEINSRKIRGTEEHITNAAIVDLGLRRYPPGTVLIAMYGQGATRGRVAMLEIEACINQACAALRGHVGRVDQTYLYHLLRSRHEELRSLGQGSNQTNLSAAVISTYRVPFPASLGDQARIGARLSTFDSVIEKENLTREKLVKMKAGLSADLLSGRVHVPQDSLP